MEQIMFRCEPEKFIDVDDWKEEEEDKLFKHAKGAIVAPVDKFFNVELEQMNYFIIPKKSHNSIKMRQHCTKYLNYFEKFFDPEHELFSNYCKIKYCIDFEDCYTKEDFKSDLNNYILSPTIMYKVHRMNKSNYKLVLTYRNKKDPVLQYNTKHGAIMMKISLLMNIFIPIIGHFIHRHKLNNNDTILEFFDMILSKFTSVDIYNKLYETASSNVMRSKNDHPLWLKQDIRGKNTTTHSIDSVENILLNIMPKYNYSGNLVSLNYTSINKNIRYQVTDIGYEYDFIPLSSSNRDEDNNSEFDKFESYLVKQDESLYLQNKVNCEDSMNRLIESYGPITDEEVEFTKKELVKNNKPIIEPFQQELVFNLFYKYFGNPVSIKSISRDDYIKLIIISKRMLLDKNLIVLPYIISGRIDNYVYRKGLNKRDLNKLVSSPDYSLITNKYSNKKIVDKALSVIATIIASECSIIDYDDPELNGHHIDTTADAIMEEMKLYISMI